MLVFPALQPELRYTMIETRPRLARDGGHHGELPENPVVLRRLA